MANERYVVAIGADNAGADMKNALKAQLEADPRVDVIDLGVPDASDDRAYPHVGLDVAQAVARGEARRGLLVCGTGIGMAISANKVPGIRATVAHDSYSVERSVLSNDCQILALGARVIGPELAQRLVAMIGRLDGSRRCSGFRRHGFVLVARGHPRLVGARSRNRG